jgi:hypothetical protein
MFLLKAILLTIPKLPQIAKLPANDAKPAAGVPSPENASR